MNASFVSFVFCYDFVNTTLSHIIISSFVFYLFLAKINWIKLSLHFVNRGDLVSIRTVRFTSWFHRWLSEMPVDFLKNGRKWEIEWIAYLRPTWIPRLIGIDFLRIELCQPNVRIDWFIRFTCHTLNITPLIELPSMRLRIYHSWSHTNQHTHRQKRKQKR